MGYANNPQLFTYVYLIYMYIKYSTLHAYIKDVNESTCLSFR